MVMEYWILLTLIFAIASVNSQTSNFSFKYYEDVDPYIERQVSLQGSYANLGPFPHWCLGDIGHCAEGYSLNLWVKFHQVKEDTPGIVVFTTGGHSCYSNGIYLIQRYGNEYEFGTVYQESSWKVKFHIIPEFWVNLQATWAFDQGLTVHIDGGTQQEIMPSIRDHEVLEFDPFPDVVIGLDLDDTPHTEDLRFEIESLSIFNWTQVTNSTHEEEELRWLGCKLEERTPSHSAASLADCQRHCRSSMHSVAVILNDKTCACDLLNNVHNLTKNDTTCTTDAAWNYYVIAAVQKDTDYKITLTVSKLGIKPYVKPFEAVLIQIEPNFDVQVPYIVYTGDGNEIEVSGNDLSYYWMAPGVYDISVETKIGIISIKANTNCTIEDVDEGEKGDFVIVSAYQDRSTDTFLAQTRLVSIDHESPNCSVQFLDNTTSESFTNLNEYVENKDFDHFFPSFGRFGITAQCENPYGIINNETEFTAQKLDTTFHFHEQGTRFRTTMAGNDSFFEDVFLTHNDLNVSLPFHRYDTSLIIYPEDLRLQENLITYNFKETVVDKRILHVQNIITKPAILSEQFSGAWNLTTNITIHVPAGNNMMMNVSISAGDLLYENLFYLHYLPVKRSLVLRAEFPDLGYFPIIANFSNDISYNATEALISVEVPIETMDLSFQNITDKENPVQLKINLNEGKRGPARVRFEVDYGNGHIDTYHYLSETIYFTRFQKDYVYSDWGIYEICVRAYNEISSVTDCKIVQVGQKIRYVDIHMPTAGRFRVDEIMTTIVRCPKGSDKTYVIEFGDGDTFVFTDRYLKATENFESTTIEVTSMDPTTEVTSANSTVITDNSNKTITNTTMLGDGTTGIFNTTTLPNTQTITDTTNESPMTPTSAPVTAEQPYRRRRRDVGSGGTTDEAVTAMYSSSSSMGSSEGPTSQEQTTVNSTTTGSTEANTSTSGDNSTSFTNPAFNGTTGSTNGSTGLNDTNDTFTTVWTTENSTSTVIVPTTTEEITTTTPAPPTTMEPLPETYEQPHSTNDSTARRLRDGSIAVTHRYNMSGIYTVKIRAFNHFNWAKDTLCPLVIVTDANTTSCSKPIVTPNKYPSSLNNPMNFYRSVRINLTATVSLGRCSSLQPTYSWKAVRLTEEEGKLVERPLKDVCSLETSDKILKIPEVSLKFGLYKVTLTVSPAGHPLDATMQDFYFNVNPSMPYAIIEGNEEHLWFLVYGTTMVKFPRSIDPDFNTTDNLEFDLVCMDEQDKTRTAKETRDSLISKSSLVTSDITYRYKTKNPISLYQYGTCFEPKANLSKDVRFPNGEFQIPSEYFVADVSSFAIRLFVSNGNLTASAVMTFEIRLSNSSDLLSQLDDLLKSNDTTGVMRAVEALTANLITSDGNGTEDFEEQEKQKQLKDKLINALDTVSTGVKDILQASGMLGLVTDLTKDSTSVSDSARVGATSAIQNSAKVTEEFSDEPLESLSGIGQQVVDGVSNVLPKEDEKAKELAEHEKAVAKAEAEAAAAEAAANGETPTDPETDGADIVLEEEEEEEEIDLSSTEPLPYTKLLKKCNLLHSRELDKLYKYLMFYESIFRYAIKTFSNDTMIDAEILKMNKNDIFCYLGVLEEPEDIEWYVSRYCDDEKRKRDQIRKNADRDVSKSFLGAIDSVAGVVLNKTEGNQTVALGAPGLSVAMKKVAANDSEGEEGITSQNGASIQMPKSILAGSSGNDSEEVGQTVVVNDKSPFTYGEQESTVGGVLTLKYTKAGSKDEVKVENTTEPVRLFLPNDPSRLGAPSIFALKVDNNDVNGAVNIHIWNNTKNDSTFHCIVRPLNGSQSEFTIMIQYQHAPNETHHLAMVTLPHPKGSFPNAASEEEDDILRHTFFPHPDNTSKAGNYSIAVKLKEARMDFTETQQYYYYSMQWFQGGCQWWNHENETWNSDGCMVGNRTTPNQTECLCNHLTSFGGDMVVPPNTIDFSNVWAKFKSLNENAAVFSTVVVLLGLYIIFLIWARYMDKRDIIKWGATPLEDNLPTDNYHYQLSVSTGVRKNAGTSSNISIIVSGEVCDTGVRRLFDGKRKRHESGSIMNYILSVEAKLGPLNYLRIWHDNSGQGKMRSWFLDQIEVTDLQTGERYFFLNNRWLACEEDDGMVDRILPVAGLEDLVAFKQLFSSSVRKKLTSDHLWLSVFSRPTRSKFTRVQRISCCMSLLFLTMITNAMWFKSDSEGETNSNQQVVALRLGPFSFTLQQVFISLASTIIVFPPSFLLVTLFRRTKQKKNTILQANQRLPKRGKWKNVGNNNTHSQVWGAVPKTPKFKKFKQSIQDLIKGSNRSKYDAGDDDESGIPAPTIAGDPDARKNAQKKKKKPLMLPFWCSYIAWTLCFFSIITPAFFTILYSMEWGKEKANEWLVTFLLSFFQSVIVVQPIKVLCLVAFIACVLKKPDLEEDGDCSDELNNAIAAHDQELTTKGQDVISEIAERRRKANAEFEPPDEEALAESRENRLKEVKMEGILKEIFVYGFFVLVLFFLSYQQRDRQSYQFNENLRATFLGKFEKIMTVLDYWVWLEKVFLPALYVAKYHNGSLIQPWWERRCIFDFESRRMGIARIRQMRIKEDTCDVPSVIRDEINHCRNDYNWFDDDTAPYMAGWKEPDEKNATILEDLEDVDPWVYQNSVKLKNAPYMATLQTYKGGGYVINFERSYRRTVRNLTRLRSENWLDLRTRAIFLEFTVYNPNANLFASVIMTTEFPATGAAVPRSEFKVFRLQSYVGGFAIVVILFEVLYCCFTLFFFVRCIKNVKKLKCKYFSSFWDILEFVLLCFAVACIVMYVFKHILTEVAFNSLKNQSKAEYVNFQSLALYDEMYGYMTAFVVFLASIQFLKLLQFNKKMNMLGDTVKLATKDLKVFSIAFLIYFFAFVVTAYLLFGQHMSAYNGVIQSTESAFAFTLGDFDFEGMSGAQKILGPLFFFAFIAVIYIGMMSIFLTIIADSFTTVKEEVGNKKNDYEMVDFIWRKFKGIIGVK